jgi:hypothetical protein
LQEHVISIFRVKKQAKQETSMNTEPCLPPAFMLVSSFAYSLTLNMQVGCSPEMSADFP